jgi:hypothetical protein
MHALYVEVSADESTIAQARERLPREAVPRLRAQGAKSAFWLAPHSGIGVAVAMFDTEDEARQAAGHMNIGDQADADPGMIVLTIDVREVLAHL